MNSMRFEVSLGIWVKGGGSEASTWRVDRPHDTHISSKALIAAVRKRIMVEEKLDPDMEQRGGISDP